MKHREARALLILLFTAAVWGFAFAAQREASKYLEPFSFGAVRFFLGAAALYPIVRRRNKRASLPSISKKDMGAGVVVGLFLFAGSTLQQKGIGLTSAGQAGFLSALYVVMVPVFGALFFKRRTSAKTWFSLLLSVPALYLLCMTDEGFHIREGDAWVLISVIFWTLHILATDHFVTEHDPMHLCFVQFLTCGILNAICAALFESFSLQNVWSAALPLLYVGVLSTSVAYTLQAIGQRDAKPAHAALIMSMESVFSVIAGALLLDEQMGAKALIGCGLMFAAVVLSQIGARNKEESLNV